VAAALLPVTCWPPERTCGSHSNIFDISVALKAQVKYIAKNLGMGVEFQEIRQGDRPLLDYLLPKLKAKSMEEFAQLEVVTEPLRAAAAG